MAQDLPQYKNQRAITPAGGGSDANSAFSGLTNSAMQTVRLGSQLSQNAANKIAQLEGIKAAQTPGRKILPEMTEAGSHFEEVYKHEVGQNLRFESNKLLQKLYTEASKNPNQQSLDAFQKHALTGLQELLNISPDDMRPALGRAFETSYSANVLQLSQAVEDENHRQLVNNFKMTSDENNQAVINYQLAGSHEAARSTYETQMQNIDNALKNGYIEPHQAKEQKEMLRLNNQKAFYQRKALEAEEEGRGETFLKELVTDPPSHLKPTEATEVNASVHQFLQQRRSYLQGQQYIEYNKALQDLATGNLTPSNLSDYKEKLSAQNFSALELEVTKQHAKEIQATQLFNEMVGNFSSPAAMSQYTGNQIDEVFSRVVTMAQQARAESGQDAPLTLLDKAQLASEIKAPIPSLTKELQASAQYGDVRSALEASRAIRMLQHNNPATLKNIDKDAVSVAHLFDLYSRNTSMQPDDALKAARGDVYNVDENKRRERIESLNAWKKDSGLNDYTSKLKFIAQGIGATKGILFKSGDISRVPAGLSTVFDDLLLSTVQRVGNPDIAAQMVLDELKTVYQPSNTNNRNELMAMPPESALPNPVWAENDKLRALKNLVDLNKDARQKGHFTYGELEWPDAPETKDLLSKPLHKGDIEILVDGVKRKVVIVSDALTQLSPEGRPSWGFAYVDEHGFEMPIMDLTTPNAVARWKPDYQELDRQVNVYKENKLESAKAVRKHRQELNELIDKGARETFLEGTP